MTVGIAGTGPAVEAVEAALGDVGVDSERQQALDVGAFELAVVVDVAGAAAFDRTNDLALDSGTPWIAVELGGIGGVPVVDAAITGFDGTTGCYDCLTARVRSNVDPSETPTEAQPPATARFAGAIAGRAAASTLVDDVDGPAVFGHVIELPYHRRQFLPVPNCSCGNDADGTIEREETHRNVDESLALAEQGLDERVGIIQEVGEVESYPLPYYMAKTAETSGFSDATSPTRAAAGVALDWNDALMKSFGEAYERYAASVYRTASLLEATANVLDNPVAPTAFVGAGPVDGHTRLWIEGEDLSTGQTVKLPASLVVYPPPEERIRPATTSGLGFGNDIVEALLSGLYEVVERDAAMLSWYSTFEPLGLAVEDDDFETLKARLGAEGLEVTTLLLTQDVDVPVVACAVHREGEWPRFAIGSSARLDPVAAARSALTEATQNWLELRRMGREAAANAGGAIGEYAALPEQAQSFIDTGSVVPATDVGPTEQPTGDAELDALLDRVTDAELTPYGTRLTPRDIADLGFEAVRVLVPSAQPLFLEEPYFGDRLETVPEQLGFEPRPNRAFHPFP